MNPALFIELSAEDIAYLKGFTTSFLVSLGFTRVQATSIHSYPGQISEVHPAWYSGIDGRSLIEQLEDHLRLVSAVNVMITREGIPLGSPSTERVPFTFWDTTSNENIGIIPPIKPKKKSLTSKQFWEKKFRDDRYKNYHFPIANYTSSTYYDKDCNLNHGNDNEGAFYIRYSNGKGTKEYRHDMSVRYQDTLIKYEGAVVSVVDTTDFGESLYFKVRSKFPKLPNQFTIKVSDKFDITIPPLGVFNISDNVVFIQRKHKASSPARYRKALRLDALTFHSVYRDSLSILDRYSDILDSDSDTSIESFEEELIREIFYPTFFSYDDAMSKLLSGNRIGCALTSSISIGLDFKSDSILLYRNKWPIGSYDLESNLFKLEINLFLHEIAEAGIPI